MGHDPAGIERLDSLLERANTALKRAATQASRPGDDFAEGAATSAGDLIRVRVGRDQLRSLDIDPRAMRMSSHDLAAEIVDAVNRAFRTLGALPGDAELPADARSAGEALAGELRDIQDESVRSMMTFVGAMRDVVACIERNPGQR